jgi:hypothetical protein
VLDERRHPLPAPAKSPDSNADRLAARSCASSDARRCDGGFALRAARYSYLSSAWSADGSRSSTTMKSENPPVLPRVRTEPRPRRWSCRRTRRRAAPCTGAAANRG